MPAYSQDAELSPDGKPLTVRLPLTLRKRGGRKVIISPAGEQQWTPARPPGPGSTAQRHPERPRTCCPATSTATSKFPRVDRRVNTTKGGPWGPECIDPVNL